MILTNLNMTAFRGMSDVRLDDLAPVSILVGDNNAGKSSVLEAAALLLRPFDPTQWIQMARCRDSDMLLVDGIWSLFPSGVSLQVDEGSKQTKLLRIDGCVAGEPRELSAEGIASLNWGAKETEQIVLEVEAEVKTGVNEYKQTLKFGSWPFAGTKQEVMLYKSFTVTPATHRSTRSMVELLSKAVDEGKKKFAVELLNLFDPEVKGLDVSTSRSRSGVRVTHGTRGVVDLASFGDGMRRAAALALALVRSQGGLLLVDELEASIHPRILPQVLKDLFKAAELADVQILATTHSLETIDALVEALRETPDRAVAYYMRREGEQHIVRRYDQAKIASLREGGVDLR